MNKQLEDILLGLLIAFESQRTAPPVRAADFIAPYVESAQELLKQERQRGQRDEAQYWLDIFGEHIPREYLLGRCIPHNWLLDEAKSHLAELEKGDTK